MPFVQSIEFQTGRIAKFAAAPVFRNLDVERGEVL
jgi:hypothetical protein